MSDLPKYAHYKESGIEWLGEIPSHWLIKQLKFATTCNDETLNEATEPDKEILYVDISNVSLTEGIEHKERMIFENSPSRARRIVKDGDIIISTVRTYLKAIAQIRNAEENLVVSTGFAVLRHKPEIVPNFLGYWVQSNGFISSIVANSVGVSYPAINATDLIRLPIIILPKEEQNAIVSFLDKKIAQIDTLISKQEMLLEKLAEQRIALISHAVTKGINPDVEMKESGIEWLGEIPSHWNIWKIVHATDSIGSGTTPKSDNNEYYDGDILWVTTSELRETVIEDTKQHVSSLAINTYSALKKYPKNSVAMAMYGATIGRLGILGKEATFNQACCIFCCSNILNYKFLYYWLWMRRPILISLSNGGGQPNLNQDDLKKIKLALPTIHEQELIVRNLEKEIKRTDTLQDKINRIIINLKEYRSALITQAVTGKIDVRNLNQ